MALYADCAVLDDVAHLLSAYPLAGVTTNPSILLAAIERGQRLSDLDVLRGLVALGVGTVFMQPTGATAEELLTGARRYVAVDPTRIVPKLPMTLAGLEAARALKREGTRLAFTAVFSLPQAYAATIADADWIIPYFGRLRRSGIDACERVTQMARLLQATSARARILAASMKAPADIVEAALAGAHDITAQPALISALSEDALTTAALAQFDEDWGKVGAALG